MFECIAIVLCLVINALLACSETAFIAVSKPALRELVKSGNHKAAQLLELRENPERTLSVIQVGITFVGAFAAALGGAGAEEIISPWIIRTFGFNESIAEILALTSIVVPLTYISVIFGELVPKTLALRRPLSLATSAAGSLKTISNLISPIVTLLEVSTKAVLNLFPQKHVSSEEPANIELELLSEPNRQYVLNIMMIQKTTVNEIFVPWIDVVSIQNDHTRELVELAIISSGHTRLPVVKGDEVIGILNAKEFLAFLKTEQLNWQSIIRPAYGLDVHTPILSALRLMQDKRIHMVIVYHNNTKVGIVTMEAIFEEMVGDIYDEEDDGTLTRILSSAAFKGKYIKRTL